MCRAYRSACCACFVVSDSAGPSRQPSGSTINSLSESACPDLQDCLWHFDCVLNKWSRPSMAVGEPLQRSSHRSVVWGDQVLICYCCMAHHVELSLQPLHCAGRRLEFAACPQLSSRAAIVPAPFAELLRCAQSMRLGTTFLFMSAQHSPLYDACSLQASPSWFPAPFRCRC